MNCEWCGSEMIIKSVPYIGDLYNNWYECPTCPNCSEEEPEGEGK